MFFSRDDQREIYLKSKPYLEVCGEAYLRHIEDLNARVRDFLPLDVDPSIVIPTLIIHDTGYSKAYELLSESKKLPRKKYAIYT